ncbi:tyrosine-type recombinase/integrase [Plantactinospora solaniradicis]|uniref:Tyrosine-type recombinase/integrase n=1 Tax=Plantactinospora solaniradicis TaxID=1723736 RepID=A0ABW1K7D4_9ACTN
MDRPRACRQCPQLLRQNSAVILQIFPLPACRDSTPTTRPQGKPSQMSPIGAADPIAVGPPKTAASRRAIALDHATVTTLRQHRRRQLAEQAECGADRTDSGYVFTGPDGQPLHPDYLTRRFRRLVTDSGLPPVRLHDLRHGAASLAHSAGADLKTVQEQLGHTSIVLTADTYTSVLLDLHFTVAEATARLVLAAAARNPGRKHRTPTQHPRTAATPARRQPKPLPGKRIRRQLSPVAQRAHVTATRHPKIKAV